MTQQHGDVRDDDFASVIRHFEPPADEAPIVCDPGHSLEQWIEQIARQVAADARDMVP